MTAALTGTGTDEKVPLRAREGEVLAANQWRQSLLWSTTVFTVIFLLLTLAAIPKSGLAVPLLNSIALGAVAVAGCLLGRSGIVVERHSVKWRDKWRSRRWKWQDVAGFELDSGDKLRATVLLRSGEAVRFQIFAGTRPGEADKAKALIDELEQRLRYEDRDQGQQLPGD